ncbi:Calcium-transporting ATPase 10, plasma membrane-type [Physocladia obscura]|uniref:Calcium-transporting ATPase n=1 Tax=Physocladia obscura TaxID=109957 RepID=A0AAD5SSL2_9FUNG|nr:Calcium-transporting ATPase 10, plasma membrane-type [Physocladia obscura]
MSDDGINRIDDVPVLDVSKITPSAPQQGQYHSKNPSVSNSAPFKTEPSNSNLPPITKGLPAIARPSENNPFATPTTVGIVKTSPTSPSPFSDTNTAIDQHASIAYNVNDASSATHQLQHQQQQQQHHNHHPPPTTLPPLTPFPPQSPPPQPPPSRSALSQLTSSSVIDSPTIEAIRQHKLATIKQQQSRKFDTFGLTPDDLEQLCSFDLRTNPTQVELLNTNYGGVEGVALLLRSDLDKGLKLKMKEHTAISMGYGSGGGSGGGHGGMTAQQRRDEEAAAMAATVTEAELKKSRNEKQGGGDEIGYSNLNMIAIDTEKRLQVFGMNKIPPPRSDTIFELVWATIVEDPIIKILIVGAILVLSLGTAMCPSDGWLDGVVIVAAVVIVLSVTAGNDYSKDKKFKKLLLLQSDKKVKVFRGGRKDEISSWDVLVGDVVEISTGDEVPADGIFISGNRLVIDESPLTGETIPVKKSSDAPFMFSGCQVSEGSGKMLVTGVGIRSSGGQIQELLNEAQNEETVLQMKLKVVAVLIGKVGVASGIATFLGLTLRWAIAWAQGISIVSLSCGSVNETGIIYRITLLAQYFVIGITVVVVAVPEGLPLAVTISLAFSMFKMIKENCFVRHLDASETMGEATCICTDKTGTLTENKMTVVKMLITGRTYNGEGSGEADTIKFSSDMIEDRLKNLLVESICVNSDCFIKLNDAGTQEVFIGSATEGALLLFAKKLGVSYDEVRRMVKKVEGGVWTFSSDRKRMSTLIHPRAKTPSTPAKYRLHAKGASEIILSLCTHILVSNTAVEPLDTATSAAIQKTIKMWANEGLRTIGIAYRNTDQLITSVDSGNGISDDPEHDMVWVSLMAIKDPLRKEVPGAVAICQKAGLVIRMVTGDNILTACKIARECGIMFGDGMALEGPVFRAMSVEEKMAVIPKLQVLARSSPSDKHTLVSILKDMGEVVAVTGDGTNDAPALKEADVGFAMGISGTQIARNASDIVLLDDNFVSLVCAIRWGRNVLNSIRKFLQFQLGVNLVAIILTFVGSVSVGDSPLNTVQLLWVNLIMDSMGALALASDDPDDDILDHPPHTRTASLLSSHMQEYILTQMVYQLICTLGLLMGIDTIYPPDVAWHGESNTSGTPSIRAKSMISNEIMARQLNGELNLFAKFFRNKIFLSILAVTIIVQVICINWGGAFFGTCTMTWQEWLICVGLSCGNLVFTFLCRLVSKMFPRHHRHRHHSKKIAPVNSADGSAESGIDGNTNGGGSDGGADETETYASNERLEKRRYSRDSIPKVRTTSLLGGGGGGGADVADDKRRSLSSLGAGSGGGVGVRRNKTKARWATIQAATHLIGHMQEVTKEEFVSTGRPTPEFIETWMRFRKDTTYKMK